MDLWLKLTLLCSYCWGASADFTGRWPRQMASSTGLCRYGARIDCCWGWTRRSWGHCQPLCQHGCKYGECVGPNKCRCLPGYTGKTCNQDLNECGLKPRPCKHRCMNAFGSYKCYCLNGYATMPDGTCGNAHSCAQANCQYGCGVVKGEVRCQCPSPGLQLGPDGRTCVDVDECSAGRAACPRFRKCVNTFGSYVCRCHEGFELRYINGKYQCTDVNECSSGRHGCTSFATCHNTPGSYKCKCANGSRTPGSGCKSIPKVIIDPPRPAKTANNTGSGNKIPDSDSKVASTTPQAAKRTTTSEATTLLKRPIQTPTQAPPIPTHRLPTLTRAPPIPTRRPPTPTQTKPIPTRRPPTPTRVPPVATRRPPTPTQTKPIPTRRPPTPTQTKPIPTRRPPTPTQTKPIPTHCPPTPTRAPPIPTRRPPTPTQTKPIPTRRPPAPTRAPLTPTHGPPTLTQAPPISDHHPPTPTWATATPGRPPPLHPSHSPSDSTPPVPEVSTKGNKIQKPATQNQRGDVYIPRNHWQNNVFDFDIELGNTAEELQDDSDAGVLSCTFDNGLCGWIRDREGDLHWETTADPSGGKYLTIPEVEGKRRGRGAQLVLPLTEPWNSGNICLSFRHKLQGHHVGVLQVFVGKGKQNSPAVWGRTGGNGWRSTQITLWAAGLESVILKGERGRGRSGEMAIDDISLRTGACTDDHELRRL